MSSEFRDLVRNANSTLQNSIKVFLEKYNEAEENTNRSELSVEERTQLSILYQVQDKISDAYYLLKNLDKPVRAEGYLKRQLNGRYHIDGIEISSGNYIEFFNENDDGGYFTPSSVEHNGVDYYIVNLGPEKSLEGLRVRIK